MGGNWQDAGPEWRAFMEKVAREAREGRERDDAEASDGETLDEHELWRRMNGGIG